MPKQSAQQVEAKIRRLTRQIEELDKFFYGRGEQDDRHLYASMLEHKMDDFVRGAVFQMHTAIENVLTDMIVDSLLDVPPGRRRTRARALRTVAGRTATSFLNGPLSLGFAQKVRLAKALGLVRTPVGRQLTDLNKVRNSCGHNWLLNVRVRRKRKPKAPKPPLIAFHGSSLHKPSVFEDFLQEYGRLYVKVWAAENGLRG